MAYLNVSSYLGNYTSADWIYQCVQNIAAASNQYNQSNQSIGYVGNGGSPLHLIGPPWGVPSESWGIDRGTCIRFCNSNKIPLV